MDLDRDSPKGSDTGHQAFPGQESGSRRSQEERSLSPSDRVRSADNVKKAEKDKTKVQLQLRPSSLMF